MEFSVTAPRLALLSLNVGLVLCVCPSLGQTHVDVNEITADRSSVTVNATSGKTTYKVPEINGLFPTDNLALSFPTVGLFIGISQYDKEAGVQSTPAHTISAALMHEAFFDAALQSERALRGSRLNLPANNIWQRHSTRVNAVTLSSKGGAIASGAEDGTIVIASTDGGTPFTNMKVDAAVNDITFSPDDRRLMAAGKDGSILIWDLDSGGSDKPRTLKVPGNVRTAIFSPDASHVLAKLYPATGSYVEAVWIWSLQGSGEPLKILPEKSCLTNPVAVFGPASDVVAVASCKSIQVWPLNATRPSKALPAKGPRSVLFSSDGSHLLVADEGGVRFWWPETGRVVPVSSAANYAQFSPDQSRIVMVIPGGSIEVWKNDPPEREIVLRYRFKGLNSVEFSADNSHLLMEVGGSVYLQEIGSETIPYALPKPLDPDDKWRGVHDYLSLKETGLPSYKEYVPITSVRYSRDSTLIAIGYKDGHVAVVPGVDPKWRCELRDDRLWLLTDLQISVDDPKSKLLLSFLDHLDGVRGITRVCSAPVLSGGEHVRQAGTGEHITRKRVLSAVAHAVETARTMLQERHTVALVIYISAHGLVGLDRAAYLLPADADAKDPGTWVSYSQVLEPVRQFLSDLGPGERKNAAAVVIFDTCQFYNESTPPSEIHPPDPQHGLVIVESASPGQYAWHWILASSVTKQPSQTIRGRPKPDRSGGDSRGSNETDFQAGISVLPISSQFAFNQLIEKKEKASEAEAEIMMSEWVANVPPLAEELQRLIPAAQQTGLRQTVRVIAEPDQPDFSLFKVRSWK